MKNRPDKVFTYFKENKLLFIGICISGLFFDGLMCLVPIIQGRVITEFEKGKPFKELIFLLILMFLFILFVQFNRYLKRYFVRLFSNKMTLSMRATSYNNLLLMDMNNFDHNSKGDIMNKNLADIADTSEGIRKVSTEIFDSVVLLIGYVISMSIMDYKITIFTSIFMILSIVIASKMKKQVVKNTNDYKKYFSYTKQVTLNNLDNELNFRSLGVTKNYDKKYDEVQDVLEKKAIKAALFQNSLEPLYNAVALLGIGIVIFMSVSNVINGVWEIGKFSAYLSTYLLVATKSSKVGKVFNAYQKAKVSWQRCKYFLAPEIKMEKLEISKNTQLEVKKLFFYFEKNCEIRDLTFNAVANDIIGVCGVVHTGKSSLAAVLSGLYNYEGTVRLSEIELKENINTKIKDFIAYLPTDVEIFNNTIKENITLGNEGDYLFAGINACLDEDIKTIKNGYNEVISHSQSNISGGQQKRLGIARCLFNHPKLIVLDDPFNAIGKEMSQRIIKNFKEKYKNTIFIIVTNQQSILSLTDKVIFLKPGNINKVGTYKELSEDESFNDMMKEGD